MTRNNRYSGKRRHIEFPMKSKYSTYREFPAHRYFRSTWKIDLSLLPCRFGIFQFEFWFSSEFDSKYQVLDACLNSVIVHKICPFCRLLIDVRRCIRYICAFLHLKKFQKKLCGVVVETACFVILFISKRETVRGALF